MKRTLLIQIGIWLVLALTTSCFGGSGATTPAPTPQTEVRETLDRLIDAYSAKNIRGFMALVSEGYTGDAAILDSAVRRDFSSATNISLRYTFNNVTPDGKDKAFAAVTFTRNYTDIRSGKQVTKQGQTSLVFRKENGGWRLSTQNQPPLFGWR